MGLDTFNINQLDAMTIPDFDTFSVIESKKVFYRYVIPNISIIKYWIF